MEDKLLKLYQKNFSNRFDAVSAKGKAGQKVWVQVNNQRVQATCANDVPGEAIAIRDDEGNWYLFSDAIQQNTEFRKQVQYRKTRVKNKQEEPKLKALLSLVSEGKVKFFIGADREEPTLIYETNYALGLYWNGYITNTGEGEDDYSVALSFFDIATKFVFIKNGTAEEINKQSNVYTYCGNGVFHSTTDPSFPPQPTSPQVDVLTIFYTFNSQQFSKTGSQTITIPQTNQYNIDRQYSNFIPGQASEVAENYFNLGATQGNSTLGSFLLRYWENSWFISEVSAGQNNGIYFNSTNYYWVVNGQQTALKLGTYLNLDIENVTPTGSIVAGSTLTLTTRIHADYNIFNNSDLTSLVGQEFLLSDTLLARGNATSIVVGDPYNVPFVGDVRDVTILLQVTSVTATFNNISFGSSRLFLNNGSFLSYLKRQSPQYLGLSDFQQQSKAADTFYDGFDASPNSFVSPLTIKRNESLQGNTIYSSYATNESDVAFVESWEISESDGGIRFSGFEETPIFEIAPGYAVLSTSYFA